MDHLRKEFTNLAVLLVSGREGKRSDPLSVVRWQGEGRGERGKESDGLEAGRVFGHGVEEPHGHIQTPQGLLARVPSNVPVVALGLGCDRRS